CRHNVTYFFFQAEDGIRDSSVTGVQTCALPIFHSANHPDIKEPRSPAPTTTNRDTAEDLTPESVPAVSPEPDTTSIVLAPERSAEINAIPFGSTGPSYSSAQLLIVSHAVPEPLTIIVAVDNQLFYRRDATIPEGVLRTTATS